MDFRSHARGASSSPSLLYVVRVISIAATSFGLLFQGILVGLFALT
ncbi:hypothetical protein ANMWB30_24460 [Arthrobacter sp. MWB30]|nr:hypothetical protein ANMWB30_24460 [Arthrobacter sp. MWB30]